MNEELMNNELLEVEETYGPEEEGEESNGTVKKVVIGVGAAATVALVGLGAKKLFKKVCPASVTNKLNERKIKDLEAEGYVIYKPEDVEEVEEVYEETEEEK